MQIRKVNKEGLGRGRLTYLGCRSFVARLIHRTLQNLGKERDCSQSKGVVKANILEAKYEVKLEFSQGEGGRGCKKTFHGGGMDIFWNCTYVLLKLALMLMCPCTPTETRI